MKRPSSIGGEVELQNLKRRKSSMQFGIAEDASRRDSVAGSNPSASGRFSNIKGKLGLNSNLMRRFTRNLNPLAFKHAMGISESIDQSTLKPMTKDFI